MPGSEGGSDRATRSADPFLRKLALPGSRYLEVSMREVSDLPRVSGVTSLAAIGADLAIAI